MAVQSTSLYLILGNAHFLPCCHRNRLFFGKQLSFILSYTVKSESGKQLHVCHYVRIASPIQHQGYVGCSIIHTFTFEHMNLQAKNHLSHDGLYRI